MRDSHHGAACSNCFLLKESVPKNNSDTSTLNNCNCSANKPQHRIIELFSNVKYNVLDKKKVFTKTRCFRISKRVSLWTFRVSLAISFIIFIFGPFLYKYLYSLQRSLVFLNFVSWPKNPNYSNPEEYGLKGALNFYLTTDENVKLGVWHLLPERAIDNRTIYSEEYFNDALRDGNDVIIYNHGNSGHRVASHRVELYLVLRKYFHVICWDYRGYGDSSDLEPTENGLVSDASFIYNWIIKNTNSTTKIFIWGHSLGTGVSTHMLGNLSKLKGRKPTGLILESPFTSFTDEIAEHPFAKIYRPLPWFHYTIIEPMLKNGFVFASDRHIIKVDSPILILHAKDDGVVPFTLGEKLYNITEEFRRDDQGNVTFVGFEEKFGYGHKFICRAPEISDIITNFVAQSTKDIEDKKIF